MSLNFHQAIFLFFAGALGMTDIHAMNALKVVLGSVIGGVALSGNDLGIPA